jgi:hypothetical protein
MEELLFLARLLSASHQLRTEELEAMLRYAGSVRGAVEIYLDAHVDLDALIDRCAESFRITQGLPVVGGITTAAWLRRMFARHVLDSRSLLAGLAERLRLAAAQMGFIDIEDRARTQQADSGEHLRGSRQKNWARKVMGFSGVLITAESLRARYRELMMRHHPDADPSGLERCKDVNVAYSLLISEAGARPYS